MRNILTLLLFFSSITGFAQQLYHTEKDIYYYPDSLTRKDPYQASQCKLDIYYPNNVRNFKTVVWFHGGGLTGGAKEIPQALKDKGFAVIGVGYRLSPNVKCPVYIEDAAAAVAWVFKNIERFGGDKKQIYLSGHSAGGYLAMMVTLKKMYLQKYGIDANQIAELIPFSGQCITHFTVRSERKIKETQAVIDEYAPLYWVRKDAPPMLLITGDADQELLGRYEENAYMLRMMKLAGHKHSRLYQLQGFDHGNMPEPAFPLLIKEIVSRK
ncbi:MAG: alpha/beta hydrolase [Mucilaginibacter sp.]|nr:alpha/beta hydrolase [Mucilaginibacter sp.]